MGCCRGGLQGSCCWNMSRETRKRRPEKAIAKERSKIGSEV